MKKFAMLGLLALSPGCVATAQEAPVEEPQAVASTIPVEQVAETLASGHRAFAGNGSAQELADTAVRLQNLGARPAEDGEDNRATIWLSAARERGLTGETPPFRGRLLGPAYRSGMLAPGEVSETSQLFLAGEQAEVVAIPVERTDLQLEIVEGEGERNCTPPATKARSVCRWIPIFTSRYSIRVRNAGDRASEFYLVTN